MTDNLIIFGAGASTGSDTFGTPPLGNGLLSALQQFNPNIWNNIPSNLISSLTNDFEKGMEEISNNHSTALAPLQRSMAQYFFQFNPGLNNLYMKLAMKIIGKNWDGAFATLNYERLLEKSMLSKNIAVCVEPSTNSQIEICFPHGCCNFFCSVKGSGNIKFSGNIKTGGRVDFIDDLFQFNQRIQNDPFPPVMSYFIPSKFTTSCANFIIGQRSRLEDLILNSKTVALIGIQVRTHDTHIWDPLSKSKAKLVYCSGSSGKIFKNWSKNYRKNCMKDVVLNSYWDSNFDTICKHVGLN